MSWNRMAPHQKIQACHIDMMNHVEFSMLSGVLMVGAVEVSDKYPTAATNGRDVYYGKAFIEDFTRKQLRYLVAHENFHKALRHCTEYRSIMERFGPLCNMAQDHVINLMIEEMDPTFAFVERPTKSLRSWTRSTRACPSSRCCRTCSRTRHRSKARAKARARVEPASRGMGMAASLSTSTSKARTR